MMPIMHARILVMHRSIAVLRAVVSSCCYEALVCLGLDPLLETSMIKLPVSYELDQTQQ